MGAIWYNSPPFSLDEAKQRGTDIYEVILGFWGSDPDGDQWPQLGQIPISSTLAGVAIGPKSLVDRCWLTWNLQKIAPTIPATAHGELPPTPGDTRGRIRQVSLDSPLLFSQPAAPGAQDSQFTDPLTRQQYTQALLGALYVWDTETNQAEPTSMVQSTNYGRIVPTAGGGVAGGYIDLNGVVRAFGRQADGVAGGVVTNNIASSPYGFGWVPPMLHLYLYLKAPLIAPSSQRAPMKLAYGCGFTGQQTDAYGANIAEQTIGQIYVGGRSHVKVAVYSAVACQFRIGAVKSMGFLGQNANGMSALTNAGLPPQEWAVDNSGGTVPANTWVYLSSCAGEALGADWLTIYATPQAGGSQGYQVMVTAVD